MTKKKHSASSKRWLQEHVNDHYVQKANKEGWRSRAIYKLEEIQKKDKLIKPGMTLVDLASETVMMRPEVAEAKMNRNAG